MILAAVHPWWPHLLSWPRAFDPISWWWLSVKGYALTSSWFQVAWIGTAFILYRRHNCGVPWCLRIGKHPTADGLHQLCRKHHPDLPNRHPTLAEIHEHHDQAKV